MKKEIKICLPVYKVAYSILFMIIMSLVRGISDMTEIGPAMDSMMAMLAIVFCGDVYRMEYQGKRWEIFSLLPGKSKSKVIYRRLFIMVSYLCLLAYAGFILFFWQKPHIREGVYLMQHYGLYVAAVTITIIFWGIFSQTIVNICKNLWAGLGITFSLWIFVTSKAGIDILGKFSVLAYSSWLGDEVIDLGWMWGKVVALAMAGIMLAVVPFILKKRG